ncbi:MAG TPA: hypothetical protein V6C71_03905 [Coleofasciculaceae cyanobacterium]|jgi:hypothetical protein
MKTNTSGFVFNCFNSLLLAIAVMLAAITTAKAQVYFDVIDGLFTPTQSDRFFQAGREDFEREIELFTHPERYRSNDLLQIDPKLIEQMNRSRQLPNFELDNSQYELQQMKAHERSVL